MSWEDCQKFLEKLNQLLSGLKLILPTEAQWEYACRAGTTSATYAGPLSMDDQQARDQLWGVAWYSVNSEQRTHDVGENPPNPWGLYDMPGNVREWCPDGKQDYSAMVISDPVGPLQASVVRVVRGGGWSYSAQFVRAAYRHWFHPSSRDYNLGFRCSSSRRDRMISP